jgi:cytochrome c biogenesis protein CcmG, thiol:disulfide interchange protein DsbE
MRKTLIAALVLLAAAACRKHETPTPQNPPNVAQHNGGERSAPPPPATPATSTGTEVGSAMPAYSAELLDGKTFDVANEKGHVVFLNLWATWCGPCRFEIPELEKMHTKYASKGFKVVGVSLDEGGKEQVQQFISSNNMTYPVALDPEGKLASLFQTTVIPTSVLIDRKGKIVWKKFGALTGPDDSLDRAMQTALAQ